ncbi:hypothetical protein HOF56_03535 [Candidatus Peribacteria bacterium]|jgi:hypothetical protein|nr:hypothetical protein [Candidatus Peribacteria bacterium]MBT4021085.1 hypothetical protein [Candidatus Peribacteria bacterium]MBT4240806.1 hypothetical protein [Candidatus Peribacteria bacterium]MBT4474165.1 hypothetical protein [Candidatus Peribacteria bacterium]
MRNVKTLFIITFIFIGTVQVNAAEVNCDVAPSGSDALDTHTEARFKRYLNSGSIPRNLSDEQEVRYEYLDWERQCQNLSRRDRRMQLRRRTTSERLKLPNKTVAVQTGSTVFNPDGPGSEELDNNRESRIKGYVRNDNCESDGLETAEYERCIYLLREKDSKTKEALARRRIGRRTRAVNRRVSSRRVAPIDTSRFETTGDSSYSESAGVDVEEFDEDGPGSDSLSRSEEARIRRYVENNNCAKVPRSSWTERCEYLVEYRNYQRNKSLSRSSSRISRQTGNALLRRGVNTSYRKSIKNTNAVLQLKLKSGFRPRPRTVQEADNNFQDPISVEGDD